MGKLLIAMGCALAWGQPVALGGDGKKPAALVAAEKARSAAALRTGKATGWIASLGGSDDVYMEPLSFRMAPEQSIFGETVSEMIPGGGPQGQRMCQLGGDISTLKKDDQLWWHASSTTSAYVLPVDSPVGDEMGDARNLGLNPWTDNAPFYDRLLRTAVAGAGRDHGGIEGLPATISEIGRRYEEALRSNPAAVDFDSQIEGGLHVVTAKVGDAKLGWWIDPGQGWNPVRTAVWQGGELLGETRVINQHLGDVWFPQQVGFYSPRYMEARLPYQDVSLGVPTINGANDPTELSPADIGLEVGMKVYVADGRRTETLYWDGKNAVPREVFVHRVESGELQYGLTVGNELRQEREGRTTQPTWPVEPVPAGASPPATPDEPLPPWKPGELNKQAAGSKFESEWERYTRLFIEKYKLNEDQTQKAWSILRSCQALAESYMARHRTEMSEIDRRLAESKHAAPAEASAAQASLAEQRAKLFAPINEIFEKQLKVRLEKLPTRAQRHEAEEGAAPDAKKVTP